MTKKEEEMLYQVITRFFDYQKASKSKNENVKQFAERLLEINYWEMWTLTQNN